MKKTIIFLLTFFSLFSSIKAEIYYSNYTDYSDWSLTKIDENDIVDVDVERRYSYYHEEILGDYYIEGENPPEYNLVDKTNRKEETTDWITVLPPVKNNQIVETRIGYYYRYVRPIRYIIIHNIRGSNNKLYFAELNAFFNSQRINYTLTCDNCNNTFNEYVNNWIVSEKESYAFKDSRIIIDLNNYYNINELSFLLYIHDDGIENIHFDLSYKEELDSFTYYAASYDNKTQTTIYNPILVKYEYYNLVLDTPLWTDELYTTTFVENNNYIRAREVTEYKVTNVYYYYYNIFKEYNDTYSDYYNIKDESNYKDYYRYRTRDKVQIEDNIVIDNNQELNNYILFTTVDITVESNIDYTKNGKYLVKFNTPFKVIEKEVTVNNKNNELLEQIDNYLKEINRLTKELEDAQNNQDIDNYINEINNYKNELERLSKELDGSNNIIIKYSNEINNYVAKINELNQELDNYKNKNNIDNYNQYIEELNNYNIEIEKLNGELTKYQIELNNKEKENNKIKREYENEIINLRMSDNDKVEVEEQEDSKKNILIPLIILWLLVIIILIIIVILAKKEKTKTSFVENV